MLAHKFVLTGESNFARLKELGRTVQSKSFGTSFIKEGDSPSKFGFIVSNKISGSAVERNRIKRAMKEGVRKSLPLIAKGLSIVFFAKTLAVRSESQDIEAEVKIVLQKII